MATLYEMTGEYIRLLELMENPNSSPEEMEDAMKAIASLDVLMIHKLEGYCKVITQLESDKNCVDTEIKRLTARKKALDGNIEKVKSTVLNIMQVMGKDSVKGTLFNLSIRTNPEKVVIDEDEEIPAQFYIPQPSKLDNKALKKFLQEHRDEEYEYAHLERSKGLSIS